MIAVLRKRGFLFGAVKEVLDVFARKGDLAILVFLCLVLVAALIFLVSEGIELFRGRDGDLVDTETRTVVAQRGFVTSVSLPVWAAELSFGEEFALEHPLTRERKTLSFFAEPNFFAVYFCDGGRVRGPVLEGSNFSVFIDGSEVRAIVVSVGETSVAIFFWAEMEQI